MTTQNTPTPEAALDGVELIKPGPAVAMSGVAFDFTPAIVADLADSYDPALHEAPHVKGHPATDDPALGWVVGVSVNAQGRLQLDRSRQVDAAFAGDVAAGRFKQRSLSIYTPSAPNNPTPGRHYIKHVGWLGAAPPAIKGLRGNATTHAFAEAEPGVLSFGGWDDEVNAGLWRRLRDWLIGQFGTETADKVIPPWEVDNLLREALQPAKPEPLFPTTTPMAYAEGAPAVTTAAQDPNAAAQAALQARQAELDRREAAVTTAEAAQAAALKSARNAGLAAFADSMVQQGRVLPAERAQLLVAMQALPADSVVVEFADGDPTKPVDVPVLQVLQSFIKGLPPRVEFAELASARNTAQPLDLADQAALARAAHEFADSEAKAGRAVSYPQALEAVVAKAGGSAHKPPPQRQA